MVTDDDHSAGSSTMMSGRGLLFDDAYKGPRWRYGLPRRHPVHYLGTPVDGWILYSERRADDPRFPFGTVDFPLPLPDDDAQQHHLEFIGCVRPGATDAVSRPHLHRTGTDGQGSGVGGG